MGVGALRGSAAAGRVAADAVDAGTNLRGDNT